MTQKKETIRKIVRQKSERIPLDSDKTMDWIRRHGVPIVQDYGEALTLRGLHYQLVNLGMTNDLLHYKRVCNAMMSARWDGEIGFDAFKDYERETIGSTDYHKTTVDSKVDYAKWAINYYCKNYSKNRWENQPNYVEVWIEKKAMIGVFKDTCERLSVALNPCKGYPSLTFLWDAKERFDEAIEAGKRPHIIYFGDYDPSGENIPESIQQTIAKMQTRVGLTRIALMEHQVVEWKLPPAPMKLTDSRSATWTGIGQVEMDAVSPRKMQTMLREAIDDLFDLDLYDELKEIEKEEKAEYKRILRRDFDDILGDE
jgi:hypothetical protein